RSARRRARRTDYGVPRLLLASLLRDDDARGPQHGVADAIAALYHVRDVTGLDTLGGLGHQCLVDVWVEGAVRRDLLDPLGCENRRRASLCPPHTLHDR